VACYIYTWREGAGWPAPGEDKRRKYAATPASMASSDGAGLSDWAAWRTRVRFRESGGGGGGVGGVGGDTKVVGNCACPLCPDGPVSSMGV